MYKANDIVEYEGKLGRVFGYDNITHSVHVLFRVNDHTWKVEKCDEFFCKRVQTYIWGIEYALRIKYQKATRTPNLAPMVADDDHIMEM
jgi:hypothetical protein